jgi:hypothetical protein
LSQNQQELNGDKQDFASWSVDIFDRYSAMTLGLLQCEPRQTIFIIILIGRDLVIFVNIDQ